MKKNIIKKLVCALCGVVMIASMTACSFNVSTSNNLKKSAVEFNTEKLTEDFDIDAATAEIIANKLDGRDFGKIKLTGQELINGDGHITIGDGKSKYIINVADGYITNIKDDDGDVVMTIEDIQKAYGYNVDDTNETTASTSASTEVTVVENEPQEETVVEKEPEIQVQEDINEHTEIIEEPTTDNSNEAESYISEDAKKALDSLDTDYSKVNWAVQYSPTGMDGIVISVAPYIEKGSSLYVVVGITNLYNEDTTFSAKAYAKGTDGQYVGQASFYETAIGPGNTVIKKIFCDGVPTGEIHWEDIELPNVYEESAYWESDWQLGTDKDGYIKVDYVVTSNEYMMPGYVTAIVLDVDGDILALEDDYNTTEATTAQGTINYYAKELAGKPADVAMFTNPLKQK